MKLLFGGILVVILLFLYAYSVQDALLVVRCSHTAGCTAHPVAGFTSGFATAMSTIGGLVSALVIAELAITKPGDAPGARVLANPPTPRVSAVLKILTGLYLLVWLGYGLAAFVVGAMQHPGTLQPLTDLGYAWLGLAAAAGYSYFGIQQ